MTEATENVNVRCTRRPPHCSGPAFVTAFDSVLTDQAKCPECGESWSVHMTYEDGRLIHPTDICPTCCGPLLLLERCRCSFLDSKCVNGHESHVCAIHKERMPGSGHDTSDARQPPVPPDVKFPSSYRVKVCTCPEEREPPSA